MKSVMKIYEIVVNEDGHLVVVDARGNANAMTYRDHDLDQVIEVYRADGFGYVCSDDRHWLIRDEGWQEIRE